MSFDVDKDLSLCDNYPKGYRELLRQCIETYQPRELLLHVKRASGSRQDLALEVAGAVYINLPYWIEFFVKAPADTRG